MYGPVGMNIYYLEECLVSLEVKACPLAFSGISTLCEVLVCVCLVKIYVIKADWR